MLATAALYVVASTGLFLIGLAITALLRPAQAATFLLGFAGTAGRHYLELALRLIAGAAFVVAAPRMHLPMPFLVFGGVLVASTLVLAFIPWRWHQGFAQRAVPRALEHLRAVGLCSLAAGLAILASTITASAV